MTELVFDAPDEATMAATNAMLDQMKDELWGYLGIATSVVHGQINSGLFRRNVPARLIWNTGPAEQQAIAAAEGRYIDGYRAIHPGASPGDIALARRDARLQIDTARQVMHDYVFDTRITVTTTSLRSSSDPLIAWEYVPYGNSQQGLGGFRVNPFTWFTGGARPVRTLMASSPRAWATEGPGMLLLHEFFHTPEGGTHRNFGEDEEHAAVRMADSLVYGHPDVLPRGNYGSQSGHPGGVHILGPTERSAPRLLDPRTNWSRYPNANTLRTGAPDGWTPQYQPSEPPLPTQPPQASPIPPTPAATRPAHRHGRPAPQEHHDVRTPARRGTKAVSNSPAEPPVNHVEVTGESRDWSAGSVSVLPGSDLEAASPQAAYLPAPADPGPNADREVREGEPADSTVNDRPRRPEGQVAHEANAAAYRTPQNQISPNAIGDQARSDRTSPAQPWATGSLGPADHVTSISGEPPDRPQLLASVPNADLPPSSERSSANEPDNGSALGVASPPDCDGSTHLHEPAGHSDLLTSHSDPLNSDRHTQVPGVQRDQASQEPDPSSAELANDRPPEPGQRLTDSHAPLESAGSPWSAPGTNVWGPDAQGPAMDQFHAVTSGAGRTGWFDQSTQPPTAPQSGEASTRGLQRDLLSLAHDLMSSEQAAGERQPQHHDLPDPIHTLQHIDAAAGGLRTTADATLPGSDSESVSPDAGSLTRLGGDTDAGIDHFFPTVDRTDLKTAGASTAETAGSAHAGQPHYPSGPNPSPGGDNYVSPNSIYTNPNMPAENGSSADRPPNQLTDATDSAPNPVSSPFIVPEPASPAPPDGGTEERAAAGSSPGPPASDAGAETTAPLVGVGDKAKEDAGNDDSASKIDQQPVSGETSLPSSTSDGGTDQLPSAETEQSSEVTESVQEHPVQQEQPSTYIDEYQN